MAIENAEETDSLPIGPKLRVTVGVCASVIMNSQ